MVATAFGIDHAGLFGKQLTGHVGHRQVDGVALHEVLGLYRRQHGIDPTELVLALVFYGGGTQHHFCSEMLCLMTGLLLTMRTGEQQGKACGQKDDAQFHFLSTSRAFRMMSLVSFITWKYSFMSHRSRATRALSWVRR